MVVGSYRLTVIVPGAGNLKEKRRVLESLKVRLRQRFNVAFAEVDGQDLWQRAALGVACVATDRVGAERLLHQVAEFVEQQGKVEVTDRVCEFSVVSPS
ncbi:MAG: DUF503 domain-containing protein [Elusimicrobia bacterium]|nr:DUF503 domain-containing protein [Elusimicrobiota bacterium]